MVQYVHSLNLKWRDIRIVERNCCAENRFYSPLGLCMQKIAKEIIMNLKHWNLDSANHGAQESGIQSFFDVREAQKIIRNHWSAPFRSESDTKCQGNFRQSNISTIEGATFKHGVQEPMGKMRNTLGLHQNEKRRREEILRIELNVAILCSGWLF